MPVYTVHAPKSLGNDLRAAPEKVVFVRDGFHVWAFLLGFIWLIYRRLWLVLLGYIVVQIMAELVLRLTHASSLAHFAVMAVIALFLGSEAGALRRWTLSRRKWQQIGLVAADDEEAAERRFFERASFDSVAYPARASSAVPMPRSSIVAQDAAGFFPMPDGSR
ncbi:hypothetical protein AFEL58S_03778 [Afipia felis]